VRLSGFAQMRVKPADGRGAGDLEPANFFCIAPDEPRRVIRGKDPTPASMGEQFLLLKEAAGFWRIGRGSSLEGEGSRWSLSRPFTFGLE
ncbi:MAG: hypothetical protein ACK57U_04695, partial [Planctomycetota bacterium]